MRLLANFYLVFIIKRGQIGARLVNDKQSNKENVTTKISCLCYVKFFGKGKKEKKIRMFF